MTSPSSHDAYDELSTPDEMRQDCAAMQENMPFLRKLLVAPLPVPAQRLYDPEAAKRIVARPVVAVSGAAKAIADRLNPLDGTH